MTTVLRYSNSYVPAELMRYLVENKENLVPEFTEIWGKNGFKNSIIEVGKSGISYDI